MAFRVDGTTGFRHHFELLFVNPKTFNVSSSHCISNITKGLTSVRRVPPRWPCEPSEPMSDLWDPQFRMGISHKMSHCSNGGVKVSQHIRMQGCCGRGIIVHPPPSTCLGVAVLWIHSATGIQRKSLNSSWQDLGNAVAMFAISWESIGPGLLQDNVR